jgi:hypothetical protein
MGIRVPDPTTAQFCSSGDFSRPSDCNQCARLNGLGNVVCGPCRGNSPGRLGMHRVSGLGEMWLT